MKKASNYKLSKGISKPEKEYSGLFHDFIGISPCIQKIKIQAGMAAIDPTGGCVLITGESGVGKDLLAF